MRSSFRPRVMAIVAIGLTIMLVVELQSTWADATPPSSWSLTSTPNKTSSDTLSAVSCTSVKFCVAVGSYIKSSGTDRNLIEEWDGSSWAIIKSPDEGTGNNSLSGVSCTSATYCVAAGSAQGTQYEEGIVLTFNGDDWSITSILSNVHGIYSFSGVSCTSPSFCVVVGHSASDAGTFDVIYTWNGRHWHLSSGGPTHLTQTDINPRGLTLTGVSCESDHFCAAVGDGTGDPYGKGVILLYNGTEWSRGAVLKEVHGEYGLAGVSCSSATFCVAVGRMGSDAGVFTVIDQWNGTKWTEPATGPVRGAQLTGVSCVNQSSCVAVGYSEVNVDQTLIESWDGTAWGQTPSPDQGTGNNDLEGVSCSHAPDCVAVGDFMNGSNQQTLGLASFAMSPAAKVALNHAP
jgi:hypothetical protein